MSKQVFAEVIIDKLKTAIGTKGGGYSEATADIAMAAVAQGITEYLIQHTMVSVSYQGIIAGTPPVTDPLIADTFKIMGQCAPPSASGSFDSWLAELKGKIISGFVLAARGTVGLVFPMTPFATVQSGITVATLKKAHQPDDENPQSKIWEIICGDIITWINGAALNPARGAAVNSVSGSVGTAQIVKITLT